jgi:B-cell receptor-associated protein 31
MYARRLISLLGNFSTFPPLPFAPPFPPTILISTDTNTTPKPSAQRNVYLTGFTLFLSLVLTRTFYIILDLIHTQEEYAKLKQETAGKSRSAGAAAAAGGEGDKKVIEELKRKLAASEAKERDFGG